MNQLIKKAIIVPFICFSSVSFSQSEVYSSLRNEANNPSAVEFVKTDGTMLIFEVNLTGLPAKGCHLKITNESGDIIYEDRISAESYKRTFKIQRNNLNKINFEASGKNFWINETFNLQTRIEEKLVVTKL